VAEPKNPMQPRLRDWPMFQPVPGRRNHDGRPLPRISELVMSRVEGSPSEKLRWLQEQRDAGRLDGDDPEEIAEAQALLAIMMRITGSKSKRHLDELLDEGLRNTFPASDPVSVGHFTSTEPPSRPVDTGTIDPTGVATKGRRAHGRARRHAQVRA
jgi:hypothetical protein